MGCTNQSTILKSLRNHPGQSCSTSPGDGSVKKFKI